MKKLESHRNTTKKKVEDEINMLSGDEEEEDDIDQLINEAKAAKEEGENLFNELDI